MRSLFSVCSLALLLWPSIVQAQPGAPEAATARGYAVTAKTAALTSEAQMQLEKGIMLTWKASASTQKALCDAAAPDYIVALYAKGQLDYEDGEDTEEEGSFDEFAGEGKLFLGDLAFGAGDEAVAVPDYALAIEKFGLAKNRYNDAGPIFDLAKGFYVVAKAEYKSASQNFELAWKTKKLQKMLMQLEEDIDAALVVYDLAEEAGADATSAIAAYFAIHGEDYNYGMAVNAVLSGDGAMEEADEFLEEGYEFAAGIAAAIGDIESALEEEPADLEDALATADLAIANYDNSGLGSPMMAIEYLLLAIEEYEYAIDIVD
jgi:hypothetical protein